MKLHEKIFRGSVSQETVMSAYRCNPGVLDDGAIRREVDFHSIELSLSFKTSEDVEEPMTMSISKERFEDGMSDKVRIYIRDGERFAIFDGKKKVSEPASAMKFSASGTEINDKDLVDIGFQWFGKHFEEESADDENENQDAFQIDQEEEVELDGGATVYVAESQEELLENIMQDHEEMLANDEQEEMDYEYVEVDINQIMAEFFEPMTKFFHDGVDVLNHPFEM